VARRTRDLTLEQAAYVDSRVVESADGRIPWTRFEGLVTGAIAASDPEAAAAREEEQAPRQFASATRSTEEGMRGFYVRAPFHVVARLDAIVAHLARPGGPRRHRPRGRTAGQGRPRAHRPPACGGADEGVRRVA
jgi:hypothetical protein